MREDLIHLTVRSFLKNNNWKLIAGQYPNGSDDEVFSLCIMDPELAKDNSPDPRRHSKNKLVPDLVANKDNLILVLEFKPEYSYDDEQKLTDLLKSRKEDFYNYLECFTLQRNIKLEAQTRDIILIPGLGFSYKSRFIRNSDFVYFLVNDFNSVNYIGNNLLIEL
jgi:hypothetical protein